MINICCCLRLKSKHIPELSQKRGFNVTTGVIRYADSEFDNVIMNLATYKICNSQICCKSGCTSAMQNHCVRSTKFVLTGQCPKVFEDFRVRKKVKKWHFSGKLGRISCWKRSFSACNTLLHLGILRLMSSQKRQRRNVSINQKNYSNMSHMS